MKKILCLFAIALMVVSCGKKNSESSYIPKDAVGVMYMNLASLSEKSSNVDFKNLSISKMLEENAPREIKSFMDEHMTAENMKTTFRNDFILGYMTVDRMSGNGGLIIPIKDAASFEKMITPIVEKMPGTKKQENVGKGDAFTLYANREMAIGWNDQTALIVVAKGYADQELIDLTNLESSENINATDYFKGFFDTSKDMGIHMTSTPVASLGNSVVSSMAGIDVDLKNNNFVYHSSFEDDHVYTESKLQLNDDIKSVIGYDSWLSSDYDANLLNMIPNNPAMVMKMSIDMQALYKHIESLQDNEVLPEMIRNQLKMSLEMAKQQAKGASGMGVEDLLGIFDGSMMIGLTEGKAVKDSIRTYSYDGPEFKVIETKMPYFYGAVAIKNMEKFEELLGLGMMMQRPETKGKNYYQLGDNMFVLLKNNALFVTNDQRKADEVYKNGKLASNLSGFEHKSKLNNAMYIYSSSSATEMFSDLMTSMNPYASMYGGVGIDTKDSYKLVSEYFGESHVIMNADGMETFTYTKGDGNSLERMIMYANAMAEETMKMMTRFR